MRKAETLKIGVAMTDFHSQIKEHKMKRYEFFVVQKETLIVGIEANSRKEAENQLEIMMDENDLNWNYADLEVYSEYNGEGTCPKFEPAEEEV